MSATRILQITARSDIGGGPEHLLWLARGLVERGHDVWIAAPEQAPYWRRFGDVVGHDRLLRIAARTVRPDDLLAIRRLTGTRCIDVVHTHGKGAGLVGRLATIGTGASRVHTYHGLHIDGYGQPARAAYATLERALSLITSRVIGVSASEAVQATSRHLVGARRIAVVPNGVPIPGKVRTAPPAGPLHVLAVLRDNLQKAPDLLERVCRVAEREAGDQLRFTIACPAEDRPSMESRFAGLPSVTVAGPIPELGDRLTGFDVLLSTSRWEGMPLTVIQAVVAGIPVVASDVVGNRDALLDGRAGRLYPVEAPAEAVGHLVELGRPPDWSAASKRALATSDEFSIDAMVDATEAIYREVTRAATRSQVVG